MSPAEHPETPFTLLVASTLQIATKDMLSYQLYHCPTPKKHLECIWNREHLESLCSVVIAQLVFVAAVCNNLPYIVTAHEISPSPTTHLLQTEQLVHHWSIPSIKQKVLPVGSLNIPSTYGHKVQTAHALHCLRKEHPVAGKGQVQFPGWLPTLCTTSWKSLILKWASDSEV